MKTIIKVSKTIEVNSVQCSEAKLVLIRCMDEKEAIIFKGRNGKLSVSIYNPILISKTEEILEGDWCYYVNALGGGGIIYQAYKHPDDTRMLYDDGTYNRTIGEGVTPLEGECKKILALPEHFTPEQLQDIVDGKMKDGDKVMVECKQTTSSLNKLSLKQWEYVIKQPLTFHKGEEYPKKCLECERTIQPFHNEVERELGLCSHCRPQEAEEGWDDVFGSAEWDDEEFRVPIWFKNFLKGNYHPPKSL
jgi:hypothetical protein